MTGPQHCPFSDDSAPKDSHLTILSVIRKIPRGKVCTYGRVAELAGQPKRARLVGRILRASPLADGVPWHRVVNASGRISLRPGDGFAHQRRLLTDEGVRFSGRDTIDMAAHLWDGRPAKTTGHAVRGRARSSVRFAPKSLS